MKCFSDLPEWCAGCPDFDPDVTWIFADNSPRGLNVSCSHYDLCARGAQRARENWPKFVRSKDCLPPPGQLVLCANSKDGAWYPRWGKYVDGHWEIMESVGTILAVYAFEVDWWMPLSPPEAPIGEGGSS